MADPDDHQSLPAALERAHDLDITAIAETIQSIGFECTRCGACCRGETDEPHTATVFPDEIRTIGAAEDLAWRDVARPMPYGLRETRDGLTGEALEWALQTDACGDCAYHDESGGQSSCTVHEDRPLICRTYPFSLDIEGTVQPSGEAVDSDGDVVVHECEGVGRSIDSAEAMSMARALKQRAIRDLEQAMALLDQYHPAHPEPGTVLVQDAEGLKHPDGSPVDESR